LTNHVVFLFVSQRCPIAYSLQNISGGINKVKILRYLSFFFFWWSVGYLFYLSMFYLHLPSLLLHYNIKDKVYFLLQYISPWPLQVFITLAKTLINWVLFWKKKKKTTAQALCQHRLRSQQLDRYCEVKEMTSETGAALAVITSNHHKISNRDPHGHISMICSKSRGILIGWNVFFACHGWMKFQPSKLWVNILRWNFSLRNSE